jgi:thiosulfate/3-mercaptopyruvate sulfurtransferase
MLSQDSQLIKPAELADWIGQPGIKLIDATWFMPNAGRNAKAEYLQCHLPGAVFFDIDAIADTSSHLPHMLPTSGAFERAVGSMGIANSDWVIVYDAHGLMTAPRVWWTFKAFGHERVKVLNGGLPAWKALGLPIESGEATVQPAEFKAHFKPEWVVQARTLLDNPEAFTILDARSATRFSGEEAEPRPGLRQGHIPGSRNLPWNDCVVNGQLTPSTDLAEKISAIVTAKDNPVVCSCGSGVTACVDALALYELGYRNIAVYDGSWAEWGAESDWPMETGSGALAAGPAT